MWESRVLCEISKERWEEGKSCFWISTLSTVPSFPQLVFSWRCPPFRLDLSVAFSPWVAGLRRCRQPPSVLPRLSCHRRCDRRTHRDFFMAQSLATVTDLHLAVFPFADHHLAPGRRIAAFPRYLEQAILMPYHPIVADRPLGLQPEYFIEFLPAWPLAVIILLGSYSPSHRDQIASPALRPVVESERNRGVNPKSETKS